MYLFQNIKIVCELALDSLLQEVSVLAVWNSWRVC